MNIDDVGVTGGWCWVRTDGERKWLNVDVETAREILRAIDRGDRLIRVQGDPIGNMPFSFRPVTLVLAHVVDVIEYPPDKETDDFFGGSDDPDTGARRLRLVD